MKEDERARSRWLSIRAAKYPLGSEVTRGFSFIGDEGFSGTFGRAADGHGCELKKKRSAMIRKTGLWWKHNRFINAYKLKYGTYIIQMAS